MNKSRQFDNFINGEWIGSAARTPNISPSDTSDIIGHYAEADASQAQHAIESAVTAGAPWQYSPIQVRSDILDRIGTEIIARKMELGALLSREEGKIKSEAVAEVERAGRIFKFYSGEVLRSAGELMPSIRADLSVEVSREPVGVVGVITPWNFPMAIPAWKIAPALCHGNSVIFKPAELVPASAWALTEIISRSGLPKGVFNLVMGRGSIVGEALASSPLLDAITFTGSNATGRRIAAHAVANGTKIQLEMGGKNPLIVLDDAEIQTAIRVAIDGAYYSTGQRCTATSRIIVTESIHDRFVAGLREALSRLRVGHALEDATNIGPVVDERQLRQDVDYIQSGESEGARLMFGGRTLAREHDGYYLEPALFTETNASMKINREEIFGPVAAVIRTRDYDEALSVANDTPFGLSAGIVTTSLKHSTHFRRHAQAGIVMVNASTAGVDYHAPFGGRKDSSYGPREQGSCAKEFFTSLKTAYVAS